MKDNFEYNKNEKFTVTVIQNNNLEIFLYLREGYRLSSSDVSFTYSRRNGC